MSERSHSSVRDAWGRQVTLSPEHAEQMRSTDGSSPGDGWFELMGVLLLSCMVAGFGMVLAARTGML